MLDDIEETDGLRVRLWGVRGSIPCPGPATVEHGGNTTCIELRYDSDDKLIIIDAGTGIRALGNYLMQHDLPRGPIDTSIFFSHTHWDHIMGFPFFTPIFIPGTKLRVYGPVTYEDDGLDDIIGGQLRYRYFPIKQSELAAEIEYNSIRECSMDLGDGLWVTTKYLNHPILCLGYRFEFKGKSFCTLYDIEPFRNVFPTDPNDPGYDEDAAKEGELAAHEENEKILQFIKGADLLIHDSQYTQEEYLKSKLGWGHSTFEHAINSAHKAGVKRLILFHHDPMRSDQELNNLLGNYRDMVSAKTSMTIEMAKEGEMLVV
jgi:phosphoribosyl 1,2-cyclic phosphodiesterase